jgi:hypothetical protein
MDMSVRQRSLLQRVAGLKLSGHIYVSDRTGRVPLPDNELSKPRPAATLGDNERICPWWALLSIAGILEIAFALCMKWSKVSRV